MPLFFAAYWRRRDVTESVHRTVGSAGQSSERSLSNGRAGSSFYSDARREVEESHRRSASFDRERASSKPSRNTNPFKSNGPSIFATLFSRKRAGASSASPLISDIASTDSSSESSPTTVSSASLSAATKSSPNFTSSAIAVSAPTNTAHASQRGTAQGDSHGESSAAVGVTSRTVDGTSSSDVATSAHTSQTKTQSAGSGLASSGFAAGTSARPASAAPGVTSSQAVATAATSTVVSSKSESTFPASARSATSVATSSSSSSQSSSIVTSTSQATEEAKPNQTPVVQAVDSPVPSPSTQESSTSTFTTVIPVTSTTVHVTSSGTHQETTTQVSTGSQTVTTTQISQATASAGPSGSSGPDSTNSGLQPINALSPAKKNVGAVAGGVVGGLAALTLLLFLGMFLLRRRRRVRAVQLAGGPHDDLFRSPSTRGWNVHGSFFRPMEEWGPRAVTRASRRSDASAISVPSVSEDPFWDPSQVRPLAIVPAAPASGKQRLAVVNDPFEDPRAGPSTVAAAGNPFLDPPEYRGTRHQVELIGPSRLSNSSSMFGNSTGESDANLSGMAV
ncbi:hypothetical protein FIBSPDRAFT_895659 [Athelia psychrophila]|uniref:Uncharacterized protein n=1 Tax=Athelia psychrophila TaxID=1759441 RepID=A0A166EDV7_9AGAM|nr:hypothetical protein FIBSPDRAFT_895659 [Fibularhizoctonia sp. CBS 109695]